MPALANRRVGSSYGMVEDDGTNVWFFERKKRKNSSLILAEDQVAVLFVPDIARR